MAKSRGMSLAKQQELLDGYERLQKSASSARKAAAANKDEIKVALSTVAGGAAAGYLDAQQEKLIAEKGENPLQLVKDVPTEGIVGTGLVLYGVFGKKTSKVRKYALGGGAGMLAYTIGNMTKKQALED